MFKALKRYVGIPFAILLVVFVVVSVIWTNITRKKGEERTKIGEVFGGMKFALGLLELFKPNDT